MSRNLWDKLVRREIYLKAFEMIVKRSKPTSIMSAYNRLNGDYIEVLELNHKKKIKDIFIDSKIPLDKRKGYPILVDSKDNILWIPNIKKSKYNVKKDELYDIILTSYKESEEHNEKETK